MAEHLDTRDLDTAARVLSQTYGAVHLQADVAASSARVEHAIVGALSVARVDIDGATEYEIEPTGLLLVGTSSPARHPGRLRRDAGSRTVGIVAQPEGSCRGRQGSLRAHVVGLPASVLSDVGEGTTESGHGTEAACRSLRSRPADAAAALATAVTDVVDRLLSVDPDRYPLVVSMATERLSAAVRGAFGGREPAEEARRDRADGSSRTLAAAKAHIHDHAAEALTLDDIATAVHVTPRSVQYAFATEGCTPLAYLRRVRLQHAHADLQAVGDGVAGSVTQIALAWGFGHQGRFAAAYRDLYGVLPVVTLRRDGRGKRSRSPLRESRASAPGGVGLGTA